VLLMLLMTLDAFIQSSRAIKCYQCTKCTNDTDEWTDCEGDVCIAEYGMLNAFQELSFNISRFSRTRILAIMAVSI